MIKIHITKGSAIGWFTSRGVKERLEEPQWQADKMNLPFTRREYGHEFKTITRGSKKRPQ